MIGAVPEAVEGGVAEQVELDCVSPFGEVEGLRDDVAARS